MSKKTDMFRMPAIGVCFATALAGCSLLPVEEQELQPPLVKPVQQNISTAEVKRGTIVKQIVGDATFQSDKMEYLYFTESGGTFTGMNVKLGDKVKTGDVLASIETSGLDSEIELQEINIEKIKISLEQEKAGKEPGDPSIRLKMLDLKSAEIRMNSLMERLEKSRLTASVDGMVTYLDKIKPGDKVSAYKELITISDPTALKLVYTAGNRVDLAGVSVNMEVGVKINGQTYKGKVVQTPMTAPPSDDKDIEDRNSRSIIIDVPNAPKDAGIGTHAEITIVTDKRENVLIIPRSALRTYLDRDFVQVLEGESRKEIDVEKGIVTSTEVEIRQGLQEGQTVILNY
ncbi:efflux RND transporter periplasmic adaptor subunit [Paenibacillus alkalitolerans]|uniref:efflux RND transporter periplasmic adaptor subunit n=1 Tax=Paenibacillus alkalitolerans TaxID=2799335 RepID=UPI001F180694|nr:HlyD family efflux transporter periplasmic adaptor subunit [Paenibacillus alkalitolerans]